MFKVILHCYEYGISKPYLDSLDETFSTREEAEIAMLRCAIDELNSLNTPPGDENTPGRTFTAQLEDEVYDVVIRCWDGEDYMTVTCYKITES